MDMRKIGRTVSAVAATALLLALSACLLVPGKFESGLEVRKNGEFSFSYAGELVFLPLTEKKKEARKFEPETCYGDDDNPASEDDPYGERECTADELAEQKARWDEDEAARAQNEASEAASAKAFLGGIDPDDPKSGAELAERLRRQAGWKKVEYRGNGVFDVEYAVSARLDHDFVFPTLERFSMANVFVQISRRNDGTVRIDAPGYGPPASPLGMAGMMPGAAAGMSDGPDGTGNPEIDGHFTLRTDAEILANNTDEGPQADSAGKRLEWKVNARTAAPPTALLRLTE